MDNLKVLPQSIDSEQALIAACLIRPEIIPAVMTCLQPDDFYRLAHREIIGAIFELKKDLDVLILAEKLKSKGQLEQVGGQDYLASLFENISTSAGWKSYAEIIKERAQRRRVLNLCSKAMDQSYGGAQYPIDEIMSGLKSGIRDIQRENAPEFKSTTEILQIVYKDIEKRSEGKNYFVGPKTGFEDIDNQMAGLEPKTTTYLAARPSMGKTSLALNISYNISRSEPNQKILFFTIESTAEALVRRGLSARSNILLSRIRRGMLNDLEWPKLTDACNSLSENKALMILEHSKFRYIENIISYSESVAMDHKISLIVIDHIQLIYSKQRFQSRHHEISHIASSFQFLAKDLKVPILILSQLNRDVEHRSNPRPKLADLKESGDIEQAADNVWGLYRKDKDDEDVELRQLKGRDTGIWTIHLKFDPKVQRFSDWPSTETWEDRQEQKEMDF